MKRKLIDYDTFEDLEKNALSNNQKELNGAVDILAKTLGVDKVSLHTFGEHNATYETGHGTYLHAKYKINNKHLTFENIEELVIDNTTADKKKHDILGKLVENLLEGKQNEAGQLFDSYITLPTIRRSLNEAVKSKIKKTKKMAYCGDRMMKESVSYRSKSRRLQKNAKILKSICENVIGYAHFRDLSSAIKESAIKKDDKGNVVAVRVPTAEVRNEQKVKELNWKAINNEVKVARDHAKHLGENHQFARAMNDLRSQNAMSDEAGLQETLTNIVEAWPHVLALTQHEVAQIISNAFESTGFSSYDDQVCEFMAEGILRTAHDLYSERVQKIIQLANPQTMSENDDDYINFSEVVNDFYTKLDNATVVEMKVFKDLQKALEEIYNVAVEDGNSDLKSETVGYLNDLNAILRGEIAADVKLAEEVAHFINNLVESNIAVNGDWQVSNTTPVSPLNKTAFDSPYTSELSKKSYSPDSDFLGGVEGGIFKVSDDGEGYSAANARKMGTDSWGNISGKDIYPNITNPYIPSSGDFTMKGAKGVDKDSDTAGDWKSSDTYPDLVNPYLPKNPMTATTPKMQGADSVQDHGNSGTTGGTVYGQKVKSVDADFKAV